MCSRKQRRPGTAGARLRAGGSAFTANVPVPTGERESRVRDTTRVLPRLFLTFAGGDLALVRPVAAQLRGAACGLTLDYAVPTEPFATQPSGVIRASLALRLRRCAATVCLFRAQTLDDEWVRWTLTAARELGLPLLGAPLEGTGQRAAADLLHSIGTEILPLRADAIAHRVAQARLPREREPLTVESLALTLRMMKHPLR